MEVPEVTHMSQACCFPSWWGRGLSMPAVCFINGRNPVPEDWPLQSPDRQLFRDGSPCVQDGVRRLEYALVTGFDTLEAETLLQLFTSAQLAELSPDKGFGVQRGKGVYLYVYSKYAYRGLCAHRAIWREGAPLTTSGVPWLTRCHSAPPGHCSPALLRPPERRDPIMLSCPHGILREFPNNLSF